MLTDDRTPHRYQTCQDEDCQRFACRVYREGYQAEHAAGYAAGHADGYCDGYAAAAASTGAR